MSFNDSGEFKLSRVFARFAPVEVKFQIDRFGDVHLRVVGSLGVRGIASAGIGGSFRFNVRDVAARYVPTIRKTIELDNRVCSFAPELLACQN